MGSFQTISDGIGGIWSLPSTSVNSEKHIVLQILFIKLDL